MLALPLLSIALPSLPFLRDAAALAQQGCVTGASHRNWASYGASIVLPDGCPDWRRHLLTDPQTSGGLLAAVPLAEAERCVTALRAADYAAAEIIGFVTERSTALAPVTLDLSGARLAEALAGSRAGGPGAPGGRRSHGGIRSLMRQPVGHLPRKKRVSPLLQLLRRQLELVRAMRVRSVLASQRRARLLSLLHALWTGLREGNGDRPRAIATDRVG